LSGSLGGEEEKWRGREKSLVHTSCRSQFSQSGKGLQQLGRFNSNGCSTFCCYLSG
jgi:hypothetical protein